MTPEEEKAELLKLCSQPATLHNAIKCFNLMTGCVMTEEQIDKFVNVMQLYMDAAKNGALEVVKREYRKRHSGNCRMMSEGSHCDCFLCEVDLLRKTPVFLKT